MTRTTSVKTPKFASIFRVMRILSTLFFCVIFTCSTYAQATYTLTRDTSVKLEAKTFFDTVDIQPHFKGNLSQYLAQNIRIPKGVTPKGKITTQFWIDTSGRISYVEIEDKGPRAPNTPLEKEIVRVIKAMPPWEPGRYKDRKVTVKYSLPIVF